MKPLNFFRKIFNRNEWMILLLGLSRKKIDLPQKGLVLVQVDGLAYRHLENALKQKKMPFLKQLMTRESYRLWHQYSGVPSNTPAFQGEFFYGVRQCVPAFQFRDTETSGILTMYEQKSARTVENRLEERGEGIFTGGSAYGNLFSGGASEAHVCASTAEWRNVLKAYNPYTICMTISLFPFMLFKVIFLMYIELFLSLIDLFKGVIEKKGFWAELKFILARLVVSVLIRELITAHACTDIYRGFPVVQVNYFGYDEQAHRRGPSTEFAAWSLKGIDDCIRRLWKAAHHSPNGVYDLWIYSDHGQEDTIPFMKIKGRSFEEFVDDIYGQADHSDKAKRDLPVKESHSMLGDTLLNRPKCVPATEGEREECKTCVTCMGPVAHIYCPHELSYEQRIDFARALTSEGKVPLIMVPGRSEFKTVYVTRAGTNELPKDKHILLGPEHPYEDLAAEDLEILSSHANAGDLIAFGWVRGARAVSFSDENGAHAGCGPNETNAFVLLPKSTVLPERENDFFRPIDLRHAVFRFLNRVPQKEEILVGETSVGCTDIIEQGPAKFRLMSYNVRSCIDAHGKVSPYAIARVIERWQPDIVALQEVDGGRKYSKEKSQAEVLSEILKMKFHFHNVYGTDGQAFGNAVFSKMPIRIVRAENLPQIRPKRFLEPRGLLWVEVQVGGRPVQILTTHLSLWHAERRAQVHRLLAEDWLGNAKIDTATTILCGDFNISSSSRLYKHLTRDFKDAAVLSQNGKRSVVRTWPSFYPLKRFDYVFFNGQAKVIDVQVPSGISEKKASDHLPVIADFELEFLKNGSEEEKT